MDGARADARQMGRGRFGQVLSSFKFPSLCVTQNMGQARPNLRGDYTPFELVAASQNPFCEN